MNALEQTIMDALAGNPRVHPDEISVQSIDGDVTLRGTVGSVVQREEAVRATRRVTGVKSVTNRLRLGLLDSSRRADADTEAAVLDALTADTAARASDIDVAVHDGDVTLSGLVDLASQRDRAERDALAVPGVASVHNRLRVLHPVSADDVAERVTDAIGLNAIVGADSLTVTVDGDAVTLAGTVRARADHDTALAAAAAVPGVTDVRDEMRVAG
ncbi:MAG TPA: BON domain-containing protein [Gaiellaceae bacterium]